jgi:hypothetical protein
MFVRTVVRSINHACKANHIPTFLPYAALVPLGFLLSRALTSHSRPPRMPPIPKKEDEIFTHIAGSTVDVDMVRSLIQECPGRLLSYDRRGRLPLHAVCQQCYPDRALVRTLVESSPETVSTPDKFFAALPLHMAVHHGMQLYCIHTLYERMLVVWQ